MSSFKNTRLIKDECRRLGFDFCGVSKAGFLEEEAPRLEKWLTEKKNGEMDFMENYFDMRLDPRLIVPGAKSVISLLLNYYPNKNIEQPDVPKISKYAYGKDYHKVLKNKLRSLIRFIRENIGEVNARGFVDSAPVLEKAWAQKSGLGWIGKNTNLIRKDHGSFFFVAELILDLELEEDGPVPDYCGDCTKCIDACPTQAITEPYVVDGSKCISYFTIELEGKIPEQVQGQFENWMFGCDICQDVCPWNSFSTPHKEPEFSIKKEIISFSKNDWEELKEESFEQIFGDSALARPGFEGIKRNLEFISLSPKEAGKDD